MNDNVKYLLSRKKILLYILFIILLLFTSSGCGLLHPAKRDADGYFISHFKSCGPQSMLTALIRYSELHGGLPIEPTEDINMKTISKHMQDRRSRLGVLYLINSKAVNITWPEEIRNELKRYGLKAVRAEKLSDVDPSKDTAIILVHRQNDFDYHWISYPDEYPDTYDLDTVIDYIYIIVPL